MDLKRLFSLDTYMINYKGYKSSIAKDEFAFSTFGEGSGKLSRGQKRTVEFKAVKLFRFYQANHRNIWGKFCKIICNIYKNKYGLDFFNNLNIGEGFVLGHWGRIIINCNTKIGDQFMVTHGVTIGRDIRGTRKGYPTIGNRVCVRAYSTIVGNVVIGDDVLIAPNTFVNFDVPSHSIVIGNPAKIISRENATKGHVGSLPDE